MHNYDRQPPAYARDPHVWDYVRDKMEANSGRTYDVWEGRHFAGAAAMYKNVVKKYGDSMAQGRVTVPRECADCGSVAAHYEDDYICKPCRDLLEQVAETERPGFVSKIETPAPQGAASAATGLAEALGKITGEPVIAEGGLLPSTGSHSVKQVMDTVSRNYAAMGDAKLSKCIRELRQGGDSHSRAVNKNEDPILHLHRAEEIARERGI